MTVTEIIVILGGLVLGYWLVSVFVPHAMGPDEREQQDGHCHSPEQEAAGQHHDARESPTWRWYHVLGVDENASREQIAAAYKARISQYHPDKVSRMGDEIRELAEAKSKQINAAYEEGMRPS